MACAGIDFGSKRGVVAIARRGGVDICVNEVSNRATPCSVSFVGEQRHIGEAAANFMAQNPKGTVTSIQRLLGAAFDSPYTQAEIQRLTAEVTRTTAGGVAVAVRYGAVDDSGDIPRVELPFESLGGMLFSSFLKLATDEYKSPVRDCVISVPAYYTDGQRRAVIAAASIGNVNVLRVVNEHAAIAFSYGIFRTAELPDTDPIKVAFVDMGDASTTVFIASFTKSGAQILSVAFDACLGGRDFDSSIANVFNEQFKEKYGIDPLSKPRPKLRLLKEAEKVKRVLSANAEAPLNIECLMDDRDVSGKMSREEFEMLSEPVFERLKSCCSRAISGAKLGAEEKLFSVEIVGASCRIPAVKRIVTEVFTPLGAALKTTLNMDECVARGAALMAAGLSPAFSLRPYAMSDVSPFAIDAEKVYASGEKPESMTLVPRLNTTPCTKALTFTPRGPLRINLRYHDPDVLVQGPVSSEICSYKVDAPDDPLAKLRVKVKVNHNGLLELSSVTLSKEVEVLEDIPPTAPEGEDVKAMKGTDVNGGKSKEEAASEQSGSNGSVDAGKAVPEQVEVPRERAVEPTAAMSDSNETEKGGAGAMETEGAVNMDKNHAPSEAVQEESPRATEKRVVKRTQQTDVSSASVGVCGNSLTSEEIRVAIELEGQMQATDLYIKERSEALNGLEGYVYDLRSRIDDYGDLKDFGPEEVRLPLKKELDEAEEWIYSEEGEKASKSTFNERRAILVAKAAPMLKRKRDREDRPAAISALQATLDSYKKLAVPTAEEYAHIAQGEKDKVMRCVEDTSLWLRGAMEKQEGLPLDVDPSLTCEAVNAKRVEVDTLCGPIARTPKPTPKDEKPKEEASKEDAVGKEEVKKGGNNSEAVSSKNTANGSAEGLENVKEAEASGVGDGAMEVDGADSASGTETMET